MRSFNGRLSSFLPIRSANVSRLEPTWRWSAARVPTRTLDREWGRRPTLGRASSPPTASLDDSSWTGQPAGPKVSRQSLPPQTMLSYNRIAIRPDSIGAGVWNKQKWSVGQFQCHVTSKVWTRESVTINNETHQSVDQWFSTLIGSRTPIRVCKKMCLWHSNFSKSVVTKICKGGKHIYGIHAYIVHHYMHTWYTINMQVCGIEGKTQ